jgi:hypothetical protein
MGIGNTFNQHVPSHEDDSPTLVNQPIAVVIGVVAAILALGVAGWAALEVVGVAFKLIPFVIALYLTFGLVQFWVSKAYRDGLTVNEIILAAAWPVDVYKKIRTGLKLREASSTTVNSTVTEDNSNTVLSTKLAVIVGVVASVLVALFDAWVLSGIVGVAFQVIVLLAAIWIVGLVVHFWVSQAWKDGLTVKELLLAVLWPVDILKIGIQAARNAV